MAGFKLLIGSWPPEDRLTTLQVVRLSGMLFIYAAASAAQRWRKLQALRSTLKIRQSTIITPEKELFPFKFKLLYFLIPIGMFFFGFILILLTTF